MRTPSLNLNFKFTADHEPKYDKIGLKLRNLGEDLTRPGYDLGSLLNEKLSQFLTCTNHDHVIVTRNEKKEGNNVSKRR